MTIAFDPSFTGESGGNKDYIPFDKLQSFFEKYLK